MGPLNKEQKTLQPDIKDHYLFMPCFLLILLFTINRGETSAKINFILLGLLDMVFSDLHGLLGMPFSDLLTAIIIRNKGRI